MPISPETYERVALEDPEGRWELWCGRLVSRPPMTTEHEDCIVMLDWQLQRQIDPREFAVFAGHGRLRISTGTYYIPDLCVLTRADVRKLRAEPGTFAVFPDPALLVVEAWSRSTGEYDVNTKLLEYHLRRDQEIWRLHPYAHTLTAWRLAPEGGYSETLYTGGVIEPVALPGVRVDIDRLWD